MVKWIDDVIDYLYRSIKEPGTQQLFHIERAELSADDSSKGNIHWLWKVAKILLWVAIIWGILILIYLIPGLGVPVAALAGYVGVKMTKKEVKK